MSGHSKWATIKHKKGAADKARGKLFAKLIRQVEVAAREGGGDPDMNPTLRTMYQKARSASVPLDTIEKARITNAFLVPAVLQMLCAVPGADERDFSSIRSIAYGASLGATSTSQPIPAAEARRASRVTRRVPRRSAVAT